MYLFYVDESGNRGVRVEGDIRPYPPENRFYVLLACGILEHYWYKFEQHLNSIKRRVLGRVNTELALRHPGAFGLHDAEVKSQIIRNALTRNGSAFWRHVTLEEIEEIAAAVFTALEYYHVEICAVVIDKEYLLPEFDSNKLHRKSYELLLERIQHLMDEKYRKHKALLIVDGANSTENLSLIQKHDFFVNEGRTSSGCKLDKIVQSPLFVGSHLAVGIQVADVCAYNVYRAFSSSDLRYEYFRRLLPFFYDRPNALPDKIYGLKVFPPESPMTRLNVRQ
jgi:hypothetical protein